MKVTLQSSLAAIAIVLAMPAFAQDNAATSEGTTQADETKDAGLADIVVTAQRREENLQRTAVPVTAIDGQALVEAGITQPQDLSKLVPALKLSSSGGGGTQVTIRGVGNFAGNAYAEPGVAVNLDGVYVARSGGPNGLFYDLARVEVLKGPQGTLYGRNATAGAINVITRKPDETLSAQGTLTVGNYGLRRGEAAVNLPIGDTAALRVAGVVTRRDGYLSDGYLDDRSEAARGQLKLKPLDGLSILLSADYAHIGGKGAGGVVAPFLDPEHPYYGSSVNGTNAILAAASLAITGGANPNLLPALAADGYIDLENWGTSATIDYDLGGATLTVIPAYRRNVASYRHYAAGFPVNASEDSRATSVEVRLASRNGASPFKWVVGGYYFNEDLNFDLFANQGVSFNRTIPELNTRSYAAFGQLTFELSKALRLTGGLRYTSERKIQGGLNGGPPPPVPVGFPGPALAFYQAVCAPYEASSGTCYAPLDGKLEQDKGTWKAGIEYDLAPRSLVYANVATGFKAGGFFGSLAPNTYRPETLTAYTIGSKNRFFDNSFQLNAELFYWEYKDKQVTHIGPILPGGFNLITENAGSADIYGAELELLWQPSPQDRISAGLQYLHGEYGDFRYRQTTVTGPPATACPTSASGPTEVLVNCSGRVTPHSPRWTLNASYTRSVDLRGGSTLDLQIGTQVQSNYWVGEEYLPGQLQRSSRVSNASITWRAPRDRFTVTAFIDNIEDEAVKSGSFVQPVIALPFVILRPPRTYGLRFGFDFN
ncbi:MAG TPA: TonB-dependent receptor [Sphingomonas sp.]|nr:TonB-dependent receptor [Sphingomonas sp.]